MLELIFLGTGASIPSRDKSLSCVAVRHGNNITMFDCGEGSQRQMMISSLSFMKVNQIFITHLHGDHVLGLPGLLQTMGMSGRKNPLLVCGPKGIKKALTAILDACEGGIEYALEIRELKSKEKIEFKGFSVTSFKTEHVVNSLGYILKEDDSPGKFDKSKALGLGLKPGPDFTRLQSGETINGVRPEQIIGKSRPGCSVAYTGDTMPCSSVSRAVKGVDVLIHESTFSKKESKLALEHMHSTAEQAAITAKESGAKALLLVHISNRYDDIAVIENEAKEIFNDSTAVKDMQMFHVTNGSIRSI